MPARRRTGGTSSGTSRRRLPPSADWCWCGNRAVARCPTCRSMLCERHRLQEGSPPPDLLEHAGEPLPWPAWPYGWESAWAETQPVDAGWLGRGLAEQLFHAGFAEHPELARCRPCRSRRGLEMVAAWRATTPPADGWDRACWLLDHGFEPERVVASVDAGPPERAAARFLATARQAGLQPPDELTLAWRRDRHGQLAPLATATGWTVTGAATVAVGEGSGNGAGPANAFVTTEGAAYVFAGDLDASTGRVLTAERGRTIEYKRLPDDRWVPVRLAVLAYELSHNGHRD